MTGHTVVTGCAGFIGSHLTDTLMADGHAGVGIDSLEDAWRNEAKYETDDVEARDMSRAAAPARIRLGLWLLATAVSLLLPPALPIVG